MAGGRGMTSPRRRLAELGLAPSKARGQNFLRDKGLANRLADLIMAEAPPSGLVLEIGPGLGALTRPLLDRGAQLTAVELDRGLAEELSRWPEASGGMKNDKKEKKELLPDEAIKSISEFNFCTSQINNRLESLKNGKLNILHKNILDINILRDLYIKQILICGNIPYNITTPILFWHLNQRSNALVGVYMVQKEIAERIVAKPGSPNYGRLSVIFSLLCDIKKIMNISATAFQPKPKIESTIILLKVKNDQLNLNLDIISKFTSIIFRHKRKTILNNLINVYDKTKILNLLNEEGINPDTRAETLSPEIIIKIFNNLS
jgi:16S rRNA (adenine1518-N6/adenine1519-N6)-dimethyltransferase